jgi:hypothetical protein
MFAVCYQSSSLEIIFALYTNVFHVKNKHRNYGFHESCLKELADCLKAICNREHVINL